MSAMYEAQAPDGTLVLHRTTNTTKQEAVMVLFEHKGKWCVKDVDDRYLPGERPYWLSTFTVVAVRAWRVPRYRVEPGGPREEKAVPPAVPHTPPDPPSDELKALVLKHYDPAESLTCKRPMFKDELSTLVLEVFARQNNVPPVAIERVLEEFGLPAYPSPEWAERILQELDRPVIPVPE
jgi:hypothetical protein